MITYLDTNIFQSPAKVLVNTVNTAGVMGKGIAKAFKQLFPEMFKEFQAKCEAGELKVGKLYLFKTQNKWVLNFPTKEHWRKPSKIEYIEAGLREFNRHYIDWRISSISFPLLGCGNGELDWESTVRPQMEKYLSQLSLDVYIHITNADYIPEHLNRKQMREWLKSYPESLAFSEVWQDLLEIITDNEYFYTDSGEQYTIEYIKDPEGLKIFLGNEGIFVPKDEMLSVWQELRSRGIITIESMPWELDREYTYLYPLLESLPYIEPVKKATKRDLSISPQSPALLYLARPQKPRQFELLNF